MNENINILILNNINKNLLKYLKNSLAKIFETDVLISKNIIIPSALFNDKKKQYDGVKLLKFLAENIKLKDAKDINLAIFDRDLYKGNLDYLFGLASPFPKIAIISIMRMHPHYHEKYFREGLKKRKAGRFPLLLRRLNGSEKKLYYERILKEAVHGIGHTFELMHCDNKCCIMYPSKTSDDIDGKELTFCEICSAII